MVPVGKKVRVLITAGDVLHAWYVPALAVKQDAIPGFVRDAWFKVETPGTYRGQCAELCGKEHGFMPIVVRAVTEDEYKQWVAEQKAKQGGSAPARATQVAAAEPLAMRRAAGAADGKGVYDADLSGVPRDRSRGRAQARRQGGLGPAHRSGRTPRCASTRSTASARCPRRAATRRCPTRRWTRRSTTW